MRAVVFKGPREVALEERPVPVIQDSTDVILKVRYAAICGSDLHFYRGHQKPTPGFIIGHEFTGFVTELGSAVKGLKVGDEVVVPFFTACGECFFCQKNQSSRCAKGLLFGMTFISGMEYPKRQLTLHTGNSAGTNSIDGGQAQYVRVPFAGTTLVKAPTSIPNAMLVLMADIFPTGYFAAARFLKQLPPAEANSTVAVVIGCGPVGICSIVSALTMVKTVYAMDPNAARLEEAAKLGAIPISTTEDAVSIVKKATDGRGADVVMEVVGRSDAFNTALDLVRPWGYVSSVGVYTETLDLPGPVLFGKNVTLAFGRCPVRSIFEEALNVLVSEQEKIRFLCGTVMKIEDVEEAFRIFESGKVHKIVFDMSRL